MRKERNRAAAVCLISLLIFIAAPLFAEEAPLRSKVRVSEPQYDFGTVSQGSKVLHEFTIENTGTADLVIQRLVPACGCTASTVDRHKVPAGESTKIKVEFDTTGFNGEKFKTVRVYTNDMDDPSTLLTLKGVVESDVVVEPQRVFFGDVFKGADSGAAIKKVIVRLREGSGARLTGVKSFSKYLTVKELTGGNTEKEFTVTLSKEAPLGELRERIIVGVEGASSKSINVPVFASVQGSLKLEPSTLSFGLIEGSSDILRKVKFENFGTRPVKITNIQTSDPAVSATYKEIQKGKKFVIEIALDPKLVKKDLRASLNIATDSDEQSTLSLNVYGIVPPKV